MGLLCMIWEENDDDNNNKANDDDDDDDDKKIWSFNELCLLATLYHLIISVKHFLDIIIIMYVCMLKKKKRQHD